MPIFCLGMEKKLNLKQQKHTFNNQKKCSTTQNKTKKKLKPGLVASYDIRFGNGPILVLALHKFVTCLLKY